MRGGGKRRLQRMPRAGGAVKPRVCAGARVVPRRGGGENGAGPPERAGRAGKGGYWSADSLRLIVQIQRCLLRVTRISISGPSPTRTRTKRKREGMTTL